MTEIWRIENLILCLVAAALFAVQMWRIRGQLDTPRKTLCAVVVLVLLRDAEGTAENLAQGNPGGARLAFSTVLYLLILAAVVLRMAVDHYEDPR